MHVIFYDLEKFDEFLIHFYIYYENIQKENYYSSVSYE